jgi:hypothetical protein
MPRITRFGSQTEVAQFESLDELALVTERRSGVLYLEEGVDKQKE